MANLTQSVSLSLFTFYSAQLYLISPPPPLFVLLEKKRRISYAPQNQCVFIKCIRAKPDKFWAKIFRPPSTPFNLTGAALFSSAGVACDARTLTESFSFGQKKKARVHRVPAPRISNTAAARIPYKVPYYKPYKVNYMFYGRQASFLYFILFFF
jgi:hypothetical protein